MSFQRRYCFTPSGNAETTRERPRWNFICGPRACAELVPAYPSEGASGLNRSNVNIDSMSRLARIRALEEADEALNRLSDRQSVKLDDIIARDDVSAETRTTRSLRTPRQI